MSRWDPHEQRLVIDSGPGEPLGRARRSDRAADAVAMIHRDQADQPRPMPTRPSAFTAGLEPQDRHDLAAAARRAIELGERGIDVGAALTADREQIAAQRSRDGDEDTHPMDGADALLELGEDVDANDYQRRQVAVQDAFDDWIEHHFGSDAIAAELADMTAAEQQQVLNGLVAEFGDWYGATDGFSASRADQLDADLDAGDLYNDEPAAHAAEAP